MLRSRGGERNPLIRAIALCFGGVVAAGAIVVAILAGHDRVDALSAVLLVAAVMSGLLYEADAEGLGVSASFIVIALAAALLGPATAGVTAAVSEICVAIRQRSRPGLVVAINLPACVVPGVLEGVLVRVISWPPSNTPLFYAAVAIAGAVGLVASFVIARVLYPIYQSGVSHPLSAILESVPSSAISLALALAGVGIEWKIGTDGIAFALAAVIAFSYMGHLLRQSRHRAEQYASLSWGVLAGLLRSLDIRDERTARHSAAVARFSRDIAEAVGMDEAECELAHAAGLLHDIGRFALSDRVFDRGRSLTDEDWEAIQRHPELGADMLRDLGMYGPVAEIVLCHHERIDGLGYPRRLRSEEIPEIAKIIAVAEVYDTLTASDTYRTRQSSFEALTELRRVSGSQLEGRYVEVLASLLTGEGVEYRHADAVDFDEELGIEQIIKQAGTGR